MGRVINEAEPVDPIEAWADMRARARATEALIQMHRDEWDRVRAAMYADALAELDEAAAARTARHRAIATGHPSAAPAGKPDRPTDERPREAAPAPPRPEPPPRPTRPPIAAAPPLRPVKPAETAPPRPVASPARTPRKQTQTTGPRESAVVITPPAEPRRGREGVTKPGPEIRQAATRNADGAVVCPVCDRPMSALWCECRIGDVTMDGTPKAPAYAAEFGKLTDDEFDMDTPADIRAARAAVSS